MPTHTKCPTTFAAEDSLTPEDLNLGERSRDIWRLLRNDEALMQRLTLSRYKHIVYRLHREDDRSDPLETLAGLIIGISSHGAPESICRRMQMLVASVIDECYTGAPHQPLTEHDRADFELETRENLLQRERLIDNFATPEELDAEATAIEAEMSEKLVRARRLRREARRARAGLVLA